MIFATRMRIEKQSKLSEISPYYTNVQDKKKWEKKKEKNENFSFLDEKSREKKKKKKNSLSDFLRRDETHFSQIVLLKIYFFPLKKRTSRAKNALLDLPPA